MFRWKTLYIYIGVMPHLDLAREVRSLSSDDCTEEERREKDDGYLSILTPSV
jgi:hypothetical protein